MMSCCQKASLCQERFLKVQTQLKKFLHPRCSVADSQEKAVTEWCSIRKNSGWCCQRLRTEKSLGCYRVMVSSFLDVCVCPPSCCGCDIPGMIPGCSELGRSHRAAVWSQLWEGICQLLCPQQLRGLGIIWHSQCCNRN